MYLCRIFFHYSLFRLLLPHSTSPPFFPHRNSCETESTTSTVSNTELVTCVRHVETARFHGNGTEIARLRSQTQVSPNFET